MGKATTSEQLAPPAASSARSPHSLPDHSASPRATLPVATTRRRTARCQLNAVVSPIARAPQCAKADRESPPAPGESPHRVDAGGHTPSALPMRVYVAVTSRRNSCRIRRNTWLSTVS